MRIGIINSTSLIKRADVNFNLSEVKEIEHTWKIGEIKETVVRDPSCYGFQYCNDGIPMIRIGDIKQPFIDYTNVAMVSEEVHQKFKKTHLQKYDILMSVRGVSIGKIGIYLGEYDKANISANVIIIRLKDTSLAPYVCMVLLSSVGQEQIRRIVAGSSKPTINASFINNMEIPIPDKSLLEQVNRLFSEAEEKRNSAKQFLKDIQNIIDENISYTKEKKEVTYVANNIFSTDRWDPHYHNTKFKKLRSDLSNIKQMDELGNVVTLVKDSVDKGYDEKIGYIEISNINNITSQIEEFKYDYINKLPSGTKILLKNGDILISKVRPYRNAITIFEDKYEYIVTASKNAFAVFRTLEFQYPYYIVAFLRSYVGLNQIVMKQSGTSYPTVSEDDIISVKVPLLDDEKMNVINSKFKDYMSVREIEQKNTESILSLIEIEN